MTDAYKLKAYTSKEGVFVAEVQKYSYGYYPIKFDVYRINDKDPKLTASGYWFFFPDKDIFSVKRKVNPKNINHRYILKDDSMKSKKIPLKLSREDVGYSQDSDYDTYWKNFSSLRSLYKEIYDTTEGSWEEIDFTVDVIGDIEISDLSKPESMVVSVLNDESWTHQGVKEIDIMDVAIFSELEQMLVPEFAIHKRPCSISSKITYSIVRQYVKDNLNSSVALITSDYKFCFTVKKKVKIKPYELRSEQKKSNGRSYAKPRISSKNVDHKQIEVFAMTHAGENYKGYIPIKGFKGESINDLIENVKLYLDELMQHINSDVSECEHCSGYGHVMTGSHSLNGERV
jgi:hypothetical protein